MAGGGPVNRWTASVLGGVLLMVTVACGDFASAPTAAPRTFPADAEATLALEAGLLHHSVDDLLAVLPRRVVAQRTPQDDRRQGCFPEDINNPHPGPLIVKWVYAAHVQLPETSNAAENANASLIERLRHAGWTLGWDNDTLVASNGGRYMEINLAGPAHDGITIRGNSRCVHADGKIIDSVPPPTRPYSPTTAP